MPIMQWSAERTSIYGVILHRQQDKKLEAIRFTPKPYRARSPDH